MKREGRRLFIGGLWGGERSDQIHRWVVRIYVDPCSTVKNPGASIGSVLSPRIYFNRTPVSKKIWGYPPGMMRRMEKQELVLTNRDGKRMPALLRLPDGKAKGTVMLLHGLGGWKDQSILKFLAEEFQKSGYVAFASDDSNGVLSPDGKFFDSTQTLYEQDVADAIAYAKAASWYHPPLMLIGHSMGGLAAIDYAAAHPTNVSELVLLAPAVSWKSMWYVQLPFALISLLRGHETVLGVGNGRFVLGAGWWRDFFSYDAFRSAPNVAARTLIISAEKDFTVAKPGEHRRLTKRFPHATHSTITWADHDFNEHEREVAATINQWLTSS